MIVNQKLIISGAPKLKYSHWQGGGGGSSGNHPVLLDVGLESDLEQVKDGAEPAQLRPATGDGAGVEQGHELSRLQPGTVR